MKYEIDMEQLEYLLQTKKEVQQKAGALKKCVTKTFNMWNRYKLKLKGETIFVDGELCVKVSNTANAREQLNIWNTEIKSVYELARELELAIDALDVDFDIQKKTAE